MHYTWLTGGGALQDGGEIPVILSEETVSALSSSQAQHRKESAAEQGKLCHLSFSFCNSRFSLLVARVSPCK